MLQNTVIIGFLAANLLPHLQKAWNFVFDRLINIIFIRLDVHESSQFYFWLQEYMLTERKYKIKNLHYQTFYDDWRLSSDNNVNEEVPVLYNYGFQFVKFKGHRIFIYKSYSTATSSLDIYKNQVHRFEIYCLNRHIMDEFINYIDKQYGNKYLKYYYSKDSSPRLGGVLLRKTFDHIYLDSNIIDTIKEDLDTFINSRGMYDKLGVRYKRTYLFHGPPGTGKSSISTAIAHYVGRDVFTITPSKDMTDSTLVSLISNRPKKSIIVLEDFDCLLDSIDRNSTEEKDKSNINISLSCILNILDGTYTPNDVIFIITTNDLSKIDTAIKRQGRTDVLMEIPKPSPELLLKVKESFNIPEYVDITSVQDIHNTLINRELL